MTKYFAKLIGQDLCSLDYYPGAHERDPGAKGRGVATSMYLGTSIALFPHNPRKLAETHWILSRASTALWFELPKEKTTFLRNWNVRLVQTFKRSDFSAGKDFKGTHKRHYSPPGTWQTPGGSFSLKACIQNSLTFLHKDLNIKYSKYIQIIRSKVFTNVSIGPKHPFCTHCPQRPKQLSSLHLLWHLKKSRSSSDAGYAALYHVKLAGLRLLRQRKELNNDMLRTVSSCAKGEQGKGANNAYHVRPRFALL